MKKNWKGILCLAVLWIPLILHTYPKTVNESPIIRIVASLAAGPVLLFSACLVALLVSFLTAAGGWLFDKIFEEKKEEPYSRLGEAFIETFNGCLVVAVIIMYYFEMTNQHLFFKIYGD